MGQQLGSQRVNIIYIWSNEEKGQELVEENRIDIWKTVHKKSNATTLNHLKRPSL